MSKGNYYECFTAFVSGVDEFQDNPPKDEPFITQETFDKIAMGTATVLSLLVSAFAAMDLVGAMSKVAAENPAVRVAAVQIVVRIAATAVEAAVFSEHISMRDDF